MHKHGKRQKQTNDIPITTQENHKPTDRKRQRHPQDSDGKTENWTSAPDRRDPSK